MLAVKEAPMPETKPKASQETWKDWLGDAPEPDDLYTRAEITDRVNTDLDAGHKRIEATDLQRWEAMGILPRAVVRRHGDAQYALYPDWYIELARNVRLLQREGFSLAEIGPQVREHARVLIATQSHTRTVPQSANISVTGDPVTLSLEGHARGTSTTRGDLTITVPVELLEARPILLEELQRLGQWWIRLLDPDLDHIEIAMVSSKGQTHMYRVDIPQQKQD